MITDKKILPKLETIEKRYFALRFETICEVQMEKCETIEHFRTEPDKKSKLKWKPSPKRTKWGGEWISAWFRGDIKLPSECKNKKIFINAKTGTETLFIVNKEYRGVFDHHHNFVMMTPKAQINKKYHLSFLLNRAQPYCKEEFSIVQQEIIQLKS